MGAGRWGGRASPHAGARDKDEPRDLRKDLTPEERRRAEEIGSLPQGQNLKTAWSTRVEKFFPSREQH